VIISVKILCNCGNEARYIHIGTGDMACGLCSMKNEHDRYLRVSDSPGLYIALTKALTYASKDAVKLVTHVISTVIATATGAARQRIAAEAKEN
jgi:hypothetical protein